MDKEKKFKLMVAGAMGVAIILLAGVLQALFTGLMYSVGIAVVGGIALTFAPVFAHQLTVWKFRSLKAMVSRDPINNLIAVQKKRHEAIEQARLELENQAAAAESYKRNCDEMIKKYPESEASLLQRQKVFEDMLACRIDLFKAARIAYQQAEEKLDYLEMEYDNAVAAYKAGKSFGAATDFFNNLIEKTAIKAVGDMVDKSIAQMKVASIDANVEKMIANKQQHAVSYDRAGNIVLGDILEPLKVRQ